jgi:hypothetical protein
MYRLLRPVQVCLSGRVAELMEEGMAELQKLIPLLVPIVLVEIGLMVAALWDIWRRKATRVLPKWGWILVIVLVNIFGPIAYFLLGREEG